MNEDTLNQYTSRGLVFQHWRLPWDVKEDGGASIPYVSVSPAELVQIMVDKLPDDVVMLVVCNLAAGLKTRREKMLADMRQQCCVCCRFYDGKDCLARVVPGPGCRDKAERRMSRG